MFMRFTSILFVALLMGGCQTKSDFGVTLVEMVGHYGGHTRTTAAIPELSGKWRIISADSMSFEGHVSGVSFANFKLFMQQVYGEPRLWKTGNREETYYNATDIGVGFTFFPVADGVYFYCHRGVSASLL
jgi:hypothetical protein